MLEDVGFHDGAAFIRKACSMVPNALLDAGQEKLLTEHLRANFEPLKALLHEYFVVADDLLLPALGDFVRRRGLTAHDSDDERKNRRLHVPLLHRGCLPRHGPARPGNQW